MYTYDDFNDHYQLIVGVVPVLAGKIDSKRRMRFAVAVCLLAVFATVNWLSSAELTKTQREKLCSRSRDGCKSKHEDLSLCSN